MCVLCTSCTCASAGLPASARKKEKERVRARRRAQRKRNRKTREEQQQKLQYITPKQKRKRKRTTKKNAVRFCCARRRARRSLLYRTSTCAKGENQKNRGRATRRLRYTKPRRKRNRKRTRKKNRGRSFLRTSTCAAFAPFAHVDVRERREPAKQGKSNKKTKIYKSETEEK